MAVQRGPQPGGEGAGEGAVAAVVVGGGEREGVPGVVQVGAGEQLEQVALGVAVPAGFAGVGGGAVAQLPPLAGGDRLGGDEVAAALVVDGAAAGVEVAGQAADRGEHGVVAAVGQGPQHRAGGQGAAVGVQAVMAVRVARPGWPGSSRHAAMVLRNGPGANPSGGHQPDRPVRPQQLRDRPGAGGEQPGRVGRDARLGRAGAVADPVGGAEVGVQGAQEPAAGRLRIAAASAGRAARRAGSAADPPGAAAAPGSARWPARRSR